MNLNKISPLGTSGSLTNNDIQTRQYDSIRIGTYAGKYLTSSNNVIIGDKAGQFSYDVKNSIFLGYNAGANINNGFNNIIIGNNLNDNVSNSITLGNNFTSSYSTTIGDLNTNQGTSNTILGFNNSNKGNNIFTIGNNSIVKNLNVFYHNGFKDPQLSNITYNNNYNVINDGYSTIFENIENSNTNNPIITSNIQIQRKNLLTDFIQPFLFKNCQIIQGNIYLIYQNSNLNSINSNQTIYFSNNQIYNLIKSTPSITIPFSIIKRFPKPILNVNNFEIFFDTSKFIPNPDEYIIKYLVSTPPNLGSFLNNITNNLEFNSSNLIYIANTNFPDINDSCGITPLLFVKDYPDDIIKGDEVIINFTRVFNFSEFIPNPPITLKFLKEVQFKSPSITINVISFDYVFLKSFIISNLANINSNEFNKIIISFYQYPKNGFICDINRNPIASIYLNELDNIIYQNFNNQSNDIFKVNISYGYNYANLTDLEIHMNIITSNQISFKNNFIYDQIEISNNIISNQYPIYIIDYSSSSNLININNYYQYLHNKNEGIINLSLITTNNSSLLFDNRNFYDFFGTFSFQIIRNKFISSNILKITNKNLYDHQFINYEFDSNIFKKNPVLNFDITPQVEFPFTNISNVYDFKISLYNNTDFVKSLNYNHLNSPIPFNTPSKFTLPIIEDDDINNVRIEFYISSNTISYENLHNYYTQIIITNLSLSYDNDDNNNFNISFGKNLINQGLNNIIIGSNINVIGDNSIILGNNNGNKNPINQSIIIGKENIKDGYSKKSLIIGNNNTSTIINEPQIIIGHNINNKYSLNIDNTLCRDNNKIFIGTDESPVAIGYNSNDIINLDNDSSLYVKNGIFASNIHFRNSDNYQISLNVPENLSSNITYTFPIIPDNFSRILLSTDNQGNLNWTETSTFDLNTNLNISNLFSSNIYVSGFIFGDGRHLSNVNISDRNTDDLIEGSNNLYYTDDRAKKIFYDFISNISTDSVKEGSNNLYYTIERDSNSFFTNLNNISTDNLKEGYSNLYYNYEYLSNAIIQSFTTFSTNDLKEGTSNFYMTQARVDEFIRNKTTDNFKAGSNNLFFTNELALSNINRYFGNISTDNLKEGSSNLYFNNQRLTSNINQIIRTKTTDEIKEGNINKYYQESNVLRIFQNLLQQKTTADVEEVGSNLYFNLTRFNNYLQTKSTDNIREGTSNYFLTTQRIIALVSTLTSDNINEGSTNLYYKERYARDFLLKSQNLLSTDLIKEGSSNKYIVNNTYPTNLVVGGKVSASNVFVNDSNILDIYNDSINNAKFNYAKIYTRFTTASNINIIPKETLNLNLNITSNKAVSFAGNGCPFIIVGSNVGINNLNPVYNLHVNGYAYANYLLGDGFNISNLDVNKMAFTTDNIKNGTSNRFITNNIYDRSLTVQGDLIFNNSIVKGDIIPFIDNN